MKHWMQKLIFPVFALICILFGVYFFALQMETVDTAPVIRCPEEPCRLSVQNVTDEALLEGVSASDREDGDLTAALLVESVSKFFESGRCRVTYAVVDSANNVSKLSREVQFTDYISPRFSLISPLVFSSSMRFVASDLVRVEDCLDGDISKSVKMALTDASASIYEAGCRPVIFRVSNSKADTSVLTADVTVLSPEDYAAWQRGPQITLDAWLVYVKAGAAFDPMDHLKSVTYGPQEWSANEAAAYVTAGEVDTAVPGAYTVKFEYHGDAGEYGWTQLVVVVEEGV